MTKAAEQCRVWIEETYPGTPISRFACRNTAGGGVSQHSAYSGYDSNALDVFGPGKTSGAADQAYIQAIVDTIKADGQWKWSIRKILWKDGGAHENHAHIDFYPMIQEKMWCGKSWTPTWKYSNGDVVQTRDPVPENGLYDGSGANPVPVPPPDEEDMKEYIMAQQENLNAAGFKDQDGRELVVDGIYGSRTRFAEASRDAAAASGGGSVPHTHVFTGVTETSH